jgi:hypothetical protein
MQVEFVLQNLGVGSSAKLVCQALALLIVLASSEPAGAQPAVPEGPEFQVNEHTPNHQAEPAVAIGPDGDFVVVWHSLSSPGTDSGSSIQGQRYASNGRVWGLRTIPDQYLHDIQSIRSIGGGDRRRLRRGVGKRGFVRNRYQWTQRPGPALRRAAPRAGDVRRDQVSARRGTAAARRHRGRAGVRQREQAEQVLAVERASWIQAQRLLLGGDRCEELSRHHR